MSWVVGQKCRGGHDKNVLHNNINIIIRDIYKNYIVPQPFISIIRDQHRSKPERGAGNEKNNIFGVCVCAVGDGFRRRGNGKG